MAAKLNKLPITASDFPFSYSQTPRTAIESSDAGTRMPQQFYGNKVGADYGNPQLIYCENVLPYAKGIYSIAYTEQVAAYPGGITTCDQAITLRDDTESVYTLIPAGGANYVFISATNTWVTAAPFTFGHYLITRAYVNGRSFVCYEKTKIIEWNPVTSTFDVVTLILPPGITMADIRGIGGASNYLLLFTDIDLFWCSPLNILEFSDIDAGAGQQTPIDIKGSIVAVLPVSGGCILYTARNAIAATFTDNAGSPFSFKEVPNCGGISSWEHVTADNNDVGHYAWTSNGLQTVSLNGAQTLFPAVTDFLVGQQYEAWNPTTKRVDITDLPSAMAVKLAFVGGRFLVISYGQTSGNYSAALVFDSALQRWGKLQLDHVDAFMFNYAAGTGNYNYETLPGIYADLTQIYSALGTYFLTIVPPKKGIAFLKNTGQILILQPDFTQANANGVAIFGHIAERHDRMITIQGIEVDGVKSAATPVVSVLASSSGLSRDATVVPALAETTGDYRRYACRTTSRNFDIAVEGNFAISTLFVSLFNHGYR